MLNLKYLEFVLRYLLLKKYIKKEDLLGNLLVTQPP